MSALSPKPLAVPPAAPVLPFERPLELGVLQALRLARGLRFAQRAGLVILGLLVVATCALYAWTFQTQARWEAQYRELVALRAQSRQLAVMSEALTGNLAGTVALKTPLRVATPAQAMTIVPAPARPGKPLPAPGAPLTTPGFPLEIPAGY